MFSLLGRICPQCGGCLVDEWKIDLEKEREVVCLNCGRRMWERLRKRGRPFKNKQAQQEDNPRPSPAKKRKIRKTTTIITLSAEKKKWQRDVVKPEVKDSFKDETHKQILKHQSSNRKKWRKKLRKKLPGLSSRWLEV